MSLANIKNYFENKSNWINKNIKLNKEIQTSQQTNNKKQYYRGHISLFRHILYPLDK